MNIYLITTLFVYAVSLQRGLKSGGTLRIMCPSLKSGGHVPLSPRELHPRKLGYTFAAETPNVFVGRSRSRHPSTTWLPAPT